MGSWWLTVRPMTHIVRGYHWAMCGSWGWGESVASLPGCPHLQHFYCLQYAIRRREAWEIWSRVVILDSHMEAVQMSPRPSPSIFAYHRRRLEVGTRLMTGSVVSPLSVWYTGLAHCCRRGNQEMLNTSRAAGNTARTSTTSKCTIVAPPSSPHASPLPPSSHPLPPLPLPLQLRSLVMYAMFSTMVHV